RRQASGSSRTNEIRFIVATSLRRGGRRAYAGQTLELEHDLVRSNARFQSIAARLEHLRLDHAPLGMAGAAELIRPPGIGERSLESRHNVGLEPRGTLQGVVELLVKDEEGRFD